MSEVCPCPRFVDMPVPEVVSMSESVSKVFKNLVSESESEVKFFPGSDSVSTSELMSAPMSMSESERSFELGIHGPKPVDPGPNGQI